MKKYKLLLFMIATLAITVTNVAAAAPYDSQITIDEPTITSRGADSGFVDDQGNPISKEAYEEMVAQDKQNILQRNPIGSAVFIGLVIAGIASVVLKRSKKSKR